ncbi:hypothetical protein KAH37_06535 [bacterium]|nr:hypothetical protein [bacterium]
MKKRIVLLLVMSLLAFVSCSKKGAVETTVQKYMKHLEKKEFQPAWDMLDEESQKIVGREEFLKEGKNVGLLSSFLKLHNPKLNGDATQAVVTTEYTGQKVAMNKLKEAKITFYTNKIGDGWKINMRDKIEEIKRQRKEDAIEIPINDELLKTAQQLKDKIAVTNLRNGEVTFSNGLSQYMMDGTVKNNTDKALSYIGVLVKFMDEKEEKVLFDKTFFITYTRQIQEIYPLKAGKEKNFIIPGYDAGDIDGNWTGKLQWEVYAVKIATPSEMITIDDLKLPKK